jgi:hypothetical protein
MNKVWNLLRSKLDIILLCHVEGSNNSNQKYGSTGIIKVIWMLVMLNRMSGNSIS